MKFLVNSLIFTIFGLILFNIPQNLQAVGDLRITTGSDVRMRAEPNLKAEILVTLEKDVIVDVLSRSSFQDTVEKRRDYWYEVQLSDGTSGWIWGGFLAPYIAGEKDVPSFKESRIVIGSDVRVRERPSTDAKVLRIFDKGRLVDVWSRSSDKTKVGSDVDYWYEVQLPDGNSGWVFGSFLMPFKKILHEAGMRMITGTGVRIRATPNLKGTIIASLEKGAIVEELERSERKEKVGNDLDHWYKVRLDNGQEGWIFGIFIVTISE